MIRVGTAGWDYPDWKGIVYPAPRPRGFDPLSFLAGFFNAVEINATFYRTPPPSAAASWVKRTEPFPDFRFTVKLPRVFTHDRIAVMGADAGTSPDDEEGRFRAAIAPLVEAHRLGAVLIQFPQSFHAGPEEIDRLESLLDRFSGLPVVTEFRHAGWGTDDSAALLRRRGVGWCNIDQPRLPGTLPPSQRVTGPVAYARLHGRNAAAWFAQDAGRDRRYDYLYQVEELAPWVASVGRMAEEATDTYVITNNHFRGKAAVNALQILAALEAGRVDVPGTLASAYPELEAIARPPKGRLPF